MGARDERLESVMNGRFEGDTTSSARHRLWTQVSPGSVHTSSLTCDAVGS
jgi:hypothetical protein